VPKIQGDAVELHPSAVMFSLVVGGAMAGLLGAILALPVAAAGRNVFRYLFRRLSEVQGEEPPEPSTHPPDAAPSRPLHPDRAAADA
jgi:predicted PurR-regulated permease PerM